MNSVMQHLRRVAGAVSVVGLALAAAPALAAGTAAGTSIVNRATVTYTVGGVTQAPIVSSPTGNSTPGVGGGADTAFVVDRVVNYTVSTVDTAPIVATPGATNVAATFLVTNTGNGAQGFRFTASNLASGASVFTPASVDGLDMDNLRVFVGADATSPFSGAAVEANNLTTLPADQARRVFIVANAPLAANNARANLRLQVQGAVAGTAGATLETPVGGAGGVDRPDQVDVVIAIAGNSATSDSGFRLEAPTLTVAKTSAVFSDPVSGTTTPKAIPGALVTYTVTVVNGGAIPATGLAIADPIPANTVLANATFGTANVERVIDGVTGTCTAEVGLDSNADGCFVTAGPNPVLNVAGPSGTPITLTTAAPGNTVTARFRVQIQ